MNEKLKPLLSLNFKEIFWASDIYTLVIIGLYSILAIVLYPVMGNADDLLLQNLLIAIGIFAIATIEAKFNSGVIINLSRKLYIVPLIFIIYTQVQYYIRIINPHFYDEILAQWDYAIFGVNPTEFLHQFSFPLLTEWLQISYLMYIFMPLMQGIELHYKKRDDRFKEFAAILLFGYYISYLLYFIMPAIGPRFLIHDYYSINKELPGLFFTDYIRYFIDSHATIFPDTAITAETINRDCMPSGHTLITLLNMTMAFRYKSYFRWFFLIVGTSLIFSTVYLRYHYVVDVFAGIICYLSVLFLEPKVRNWLEKIGFKNIR